LRVTAGIIITDFNLEFVASDDVAEGDQKRIQATPALLGLAAYMVATLIYTRRVRATR
jgi:hypothetical protein